jgi:hypothetical protein
METTTIERDAAKTQNQNPVSSKSGGPKKLLLYPGLALLIIGVGLGVYFWQNGKVNDSRAGISSLEAEKASLIKEKRSLEDKNGNLSKSIDVLQGQISNNKTTSDSNESSGNSTTTTPDTKLTITSVKNLPGSTFTKEGYTPPKGDFKVLYVTITNQSKQEQSYNAFQFSATTKGGVILQPSQFSPLESQGLWNNSKLAAGGSQDIVLLFPQDQDTVTLTHTPESGSGAVSVSLPLAQ